MKFATKKELLYIGIITLIFIAILVVLVMVLPLHKDKPKDQKNGVNNSNPAYNADNTKIINQFMQDQNKAYLECISLCQQSKGKVNNYSKGPCLSDEYGFKIKDWACDIAHNPRIAVDNDPKNQCKSILNGTVNHFVEVDENCNIIR